MMVDGRTRPPSALIKEPDADADAVDDDEAVGGDRTDEVTIMGTVVCKNGQLQNSFVGSE